MGIALVALALGVGEVPHSEELANKARGWVWQFAILAAGALPAVGMSVVTLARPGGPEAGETGDPPRIA